MFWKPSAYISDSVFWGSTCFWFVGFSFYFLCGSSSNSCLLKLSCESTFHPYSIVFINSMHSKIQNHPPMPPRIPNLWIWGEETTFSEMLFLPVVKGSVARRIIRQQCKTGLRSRSDQGFPDFLRKLEKEVVNFKIHLTQRILTGSGLSSC